MKIIKEFEYNNETVVIVRKSALNFSGNDNSGNDNSGNDNSGYRNSGYCNSGNCNSGNHNSGYRNSGYRNSGNCNSGNHNSGYRNSGNCNSGGFNSGNDNSGYHNSGNCNSGNHNSGNHNSGDFNTTEAPLRMFNKEIKLLRADVDLFPAFLRFSLNEWITKENMTEEEKTEHPDSDLTGGYLKVYEYKEAFKLSWDNASKEDRLGIFELPNFDADIFKDISGIDAIRDIDE